MSLSKTAFHDLHESAYQTTIEVNEAALHDAGAAVGNILGDGFQSMPAPSVESVAQNSATEDLFATHEVDKFQRDGYVIVRQMVPSSIREAMLQATLKDLNDEVQPLEYEADVHYPGAPVSRDSIGGRTIRRLKNAIGRHPVFGEWIARPELVGRLQQLLGPHVVMPLAHHNCIMTKQPQYSSDTEWHQDIRYWSFERPELVSVWTALGDEYLENGCLKLIPATHRMTFDRERLDDALFLIANHPENQPLIEGQIHAELQPGDVLFFHCRTFHAASRNRTAEPKFSAVFTFRPADNPPLPETRSASQPELLLPSAI